MTDQKQAPERPVDISRERIERLVDLGMADYIHVALLDELEALVKQRDELAAEIERLQAAVDMHHHAAVMATRHRDQALAQSAAREIAMRDRAADLLQTDGELAELIRALPLSPDGQQALNEMLAEEWRDGYECAISSGDPYEPRNNPYRKDGGENGHLLQR